MPNWVTNRLTLTGPSAEIDRFKSTCIKIRKQDDGSETYFDFGSLVPMPPEIIATLCDGVTPEQKIAAFEATGFEDWYHWRNHHWGVRWNSDCYDPVAATATTYDFRFNTPWSIPVPIFQALAQQFPSLSGVTFAVDERGDWGAAGLIDSGAFGQGGLHPSAELLFIVNEAADNKCTAEVTSRAISNVGQHLAGRSTSASRCKGPKALLNLAWQLICEHMPEDFGPRFYLHHDIQSYLSWVKGVADGEWEDTNSSLQALDRLVKNTANREFLKSSGRFAAELDQEVMSKLALCLGVDCQLSREQRKFILRAFARFIAERADDEALREWAVRAVFRSKQSIAMQSCSDLQLSFVHDALDAFDEVEAYINIATVSRGLVPGRENSEASKSGHEIPHLEETDTFNDMSICFP